MTSIEKEVKLMQQNLNKALSLENKSSARNREMQIVIDSSSKSIERLEQKIANSDRITNSLKSCYQERIRMLKDLVSQLKESLKEANELNASYGNIESESIKTIQAQQAMIRWQRIGLIVLGVATAGAFTWNVISAACR